MMYIFDVKEIIISFGIIVDTVSIPPSLFLRAYTTSTFQPRYIWTHFYLILQ
jgi:hypothetical protein